MPAARLTCLRRGRRPIVAIAIGLLIWQAVAASLVAAEATALAVGGYDAGVICHSGGGAGSTGPADRGNQAQDCCVWCMVASTSVLPGHATGVVQQRFDRAGRPAALLEPAPVTPPRVVRAGFSQPPPLEA